MDLKLTGLQGDVMKESIDAASSFVRSVAPEMGIKPTSFEKIDIHVHVPEGATPKDGPSAGLAMVTSIVSVLTKIPVRKDLAMTGEVTLRGNALGIGGLKEKLLAATRSGIKTVLVPSENERELSEVPENIKKKLDIKELNSLVLDEADEMLNLGFKEDIDLILEGTNENKQILLFSATMPKEVLKISKNYMKKPKRIEVDSKNEGAKDIEHNYYLVSNVRDKYQALSCLLYTSPSPRDRG